MIGWLPITGRTRAPEEGRIIKCPCGSEVRVYHFAWFSLTCPACKADNVKSQWTTRS